MKYIKLFEKYTEDNLIEFEFYTIMEHTDDSAENIYGIWTDKEEAIIEAESVDSGFPDIDSSIHINIYKFKIPYSEFIDILDMSEEEIKKDNISKEDLIEEFKESNWQDYYKYYEIEDEHILDIDAKNKSTDDLIDEVISELNIRFGRSWNNIFSKYTRLYKDSDGNLTFDSDNGLDYDDEDYEEYESVDIRIANHTHNPNNGPNDLNVLITNDDKTGNRFMTARTDLEFNSDNSVDEIVDSIINYFK